MVVRIANRIGGGGGASIFRRIYIHSALEIATVIRLWLSGFALILAMATLLVALPNRPASAAGGDTGVTQDCPSGADDAAASRELAGVKAREVEIGSSKTKTRLMWISDRPICGKPFMLFGKVGSRGNPQQGSPPGNFYQGRYQIFPPTFQSIHSVIDAKVAFVRGNGIIKFANGYILLPAESLRSVGVNAAGTALLWERYAPPSRPAAVPADAEWISGPFSGSFVRIISVDTAANSVIADHYSSSSGEKVRVELMALPPLDNAPPPRIISLFRSDFGGLTKNSHFGAYFMLSDGRMLLEKEYFHEVCAEIPRRPYLHGLVEGPFMFCR